jgi:hypothetical protein
MDEKALTEIIMQKIRQWYSSQEGQTDGYIYEDTFVKMIDEIGIDILQASIGPLPENRKLKKNSNSIRRNSSSPKTCPE